MVNAAINEPDPFSSISDTDLTDIRAYLQQQKALGDSRFQAHIETLLARNVAVRPRGRPKRSQQEPEIIKPTQPWLLE